MENYKIKPPRVSSFIKDITEMFNYTEGEGEGKKKKNSTQENHQPLRHEISG